MECALAADTKIETPEGALTVKGVAGKMVAVFTREAGGRVRFRPLRNARKVAEAQPVTRIVLENGLSFRVGAGQVLYRKGLQEARAETLVVGDELEPAFHFPAGYKFRDDANGQERESGFAWRITRIEPGGNADLYSFAVSQTGTFFLSAGVLAKADDSVLDA